MDQSIQIVVFISISCWTSIKSRQTAAYPKPRFSAMTLLEGCKKTQCLYKDGSFEPSLRLLDELSRVGGESSRAKFWK